MPKQIFNWLCDRLRSEKTTKLEDSVEVRLVPVRFGWWAFVKFRFSCSVSKCRGVVFGVETLAGRKILQSTHGVVFQKPVFKWVGCRGGETRHFSRSPREIIAAIKDEIIFEATRHKLNVMEEDIQGEET